MKITRRLRMEATSDEDKRSKPEIKEISYDYLRVKALDLRVSALVVISAKEDQLRISIR